MLTSLALAYMSGHKTEDSIMIDTEIPVEQHAEPEKSLPEQEETSTSEPEPEPATQTQTAENPTESSTN